MGATGNDPLVALVTGGAKGIGRGIAKELLVEGWQVIIADRDQDQGRQTEKHLSEWGRCRFVESDVSDPDQVTALFADLQNSEGRLNGLVNNAGIFIERPFQELTLKDWNQVIGTNLTAAFVCTQMATPLLKDGGGSIVNISSTRAHMSEPNTEAYATSKGGLVALTHATAISLGPEIRVNCVSPGWIDTDPNSHLREKDHSQHPVGRVGRVEDVASIVAYLLSPQSAFVTGSEFTVDGGMTRKMIYV